MNGWRPSRPAEGWLVLALVVIMALVLAWAIDDVAYVNGDEALTDSLSWFALLAVAVAFAGAKLGWGRWTTHLVGALFAGLLIPIFAGWAVQPGTSLSEAFFVTAHGSVQAYLDLAWRGLSLTSEEVHYIVVLGGLVWGTAQFMAYAVFGHRRPLNAVVVAGLLLVLNMVVTSEEQLPYLIVFTAASLFLLIGMHVFDERATWVRRRIGDPSTISSLYMRGGTVFIVVALVGSMALTTRAASSPLAGAWEGVGEELLDVGEELARLFPDGGAIKGFGGVSFGSTATIGDTWFSDAGVSFTATVPAAEDEFYWRAATYDTFRLSGWIQSTRSNVRVPAGQPLLAGTPENPNDALTRPISVTVRPEKFKDRTILSPGTPVAADRELDVVLTGTEGWFAAAEQPRRAPAYQVEARLLNMGEEQEQITENLLRVASTEYPLEIELLYTGVPEGALGPDATELLQTVLEEAGTTNPYDLALTMQNHLRREFRYNTDVSGVGCTADSKVECFARHKVGYCLHYASTMAILLRKANPENPIPTRLVQGFLPGERLGNTETVENKNAHAWVEVYFPGYGWIPFDPTGTVGRPTLLPEGPPVASAAPTPIATFNPDDRGPDVTFRPEGGLGGTTTPPSDPGDRSLFVLLSVLLAIVIVTVAIAAWLRGPRGEVSPDSAWLSMASVASRFGFAPRPTQTVYEYASSLGELVPVAQADLQTVADAKVESAYANVRLGGARLDAVRDATRRLRITLLRLVLRRPRRGKRR